MSEDVPLSELLKHTAALSERDRREANAIMRALIRDYHRQSRWTGLAEERANDYDYHNRTR